MVRLLLLSVMFLYLLSTLFPQFNIKVVISILCLLIILFTIWTVKRFVQLLGSVFLILGIILLWTSEASWQSYFLSFGPMVDLLTLFSLLPILGIPIKLGEYSGSVKAFIQKKVKTTGHLYMLTSGISYFFSIFMNLATLPMTYYSIKPVLTSFPVKEENRFISRAITRGFAMPLLWAPVTPIVGIVIVMTGVSWVSILPYVLPLSIFGLLLDWFISGKKSTLKSEGRQFSPNELAATLETSHLHRPSRVFQIFVAILIFNILMSVAEGQFSYSFIILVSLIVIPFSLIWALLLKKGKEFFSQLIDHFSTLENNMKNQFFIFLSAGFFISTIKVSHTDLLLTEWVLTLISIIGSDIFLLLLPLIPIGFAFLGLHPAVSLSLMAGALNPSAIGIAPHILTVSMLVGAVSSFLVGPYNATIGLMSNIVKESSFKVSNWNLAFATIYIGFSMLYLLLLKLILS